MRRACLIAVAALAASAVPATSAPADFRVACLTFRGDVGRVAPASCRILGLGMGDLGDFNLVGLRWTGWGATARAAGVVRSVPLEGGEVVSTRARVTLFRLRSGCGGRRWYTRARVSLGGAVPLQLRLPTCPGPRN